MQSYHLHPQRSIIHTSEKKKPLKHKPLAYILSSPFCVCVGFHSITEYRWHLSTETAIVNHAHWKDIYGWYIAINKILDCFPFKEQRDCTVPSAEKKVSQWYGITGIRFCAHSLGKEDTLNQCSLETETESLIRHPHP